MNEIRKVIKLRGRFHPIVFKGVISMENHHFKLMGQELYIHPILKRWVCKRHEAWKGLMVLRPIGHMKSLQIQERTSLFTLTGDLNNRITGISYIVV